MPWPSWTSEYSFSRSQGMSRATASSRSPGSRAEGGPLGPEDEPLQLGLEVEARLALDQVVDQPHGQAAGGQPDLVVAVAVDHVVLAAPAGAAGLAPAACSPPGLPLELEGDAWPRAPARCLRSRSTNPPRRPTPQVWSTRPGSRASRSSVKEGMVLEGKSSSEPRSTSRCTALSYDQ